MPFADSLKTKKSYQLVGLNDFWLIIIGIPVLSIAISTLFFAGNIREGWACFTDNMFLALLHTTIYWMGNRQIVLALRKRFNTPHENPKRLGVTGAAVLLYTLGITLTLHVADQLGPRNEPNVFRDSPLELKIGSVLFATVTILSLYEAIFYLSQWKESLRASERLKKEHTISQLEALKNQVNPHFLFNSLNTLAALIPEDGARAIAFVHKLSTVYRNILELKDKKVVTLAEELECTESYLYLVHERFGENLNVRVDISDKARHLYLVPLSVQILVENAIKHNVVARKRPLAIEITSHGDNKLIVRNTLQIRQGEQEGTGTGLRNINERFKLTFGREISVEENATDFIVTLPLSTIDEL